MKILILASQHGDEHLGEKLYEYIERQRPELLEYVDFLLANSRARQMNVRLIESDMNRGYVDSPKTYEERRAAEILKKIEDSGFDLVLDCHTTGCEQPPSLIFKKTNVYNERFLRATSMGHFVIMDHAVADTALNGVCPQSVSVEVNRNIEEKLLDEICGDIQRYITGEEYLASKYVYEVSSLLEKGSLNESALRKLQNFKKSNEGFYPVLVGENSYRKYHKYIGFKAYKRYKFKV